MKIKEILLKNQKSLLHLGGFSNPPPVYSNHPANSVLVIFPAPPSLDYSNPASIRHQGVLP